MTGHAKVLGLPTHADIAGVGGKQVETVLRGMCSRRYLYTHLSGAHRWIRRIWLRLHENPPSVRVRGGDELVSRSVCLGQAAVPR